MKRIGVYKTNRLVKYAIVDDDDAPLAMHRWRMNRDGYPVRNKKTTTGISVVALHQDVAMRHFGSLPKWPLRLDHKNRIKTDCRRDNIRVSDAVLNGQNSKIRKDNRSGVSGVFRREPGRWMAYVKVNGKRKYLGTHATLKDAARAVRKEKQRYWPDHAQSLLAAWQGAKEKA